jgi:predicted ester cyclase
MLSEEEGIALVTRYYEAINSGNLGVLDEVASANYKHHTEGVLPGLQAFKSILKMYRQGFPDVHNKIEDIIVGKDKIVVRVTTQGSHTGYFLGHEPTNQSFSASAIDIFRVANGKLVEHWSVFDTINMLQQLGLYRPLG